MIMKNEIIKEILKKCDISYSNLTKSKSGFTNNVYFIDNCYVIKFSNNEIIKEKLEKEITIYKNLNLSYIPKYITSGNYNDYKYLIITKINGKNLYSIWHTLSEKERTNIIIEIAKTVKSFHQINGDFLTGYNAVSFRKYIKSELSVIIEKLQKLNLNVECLQDILNKSFDKLFCDIKIGLVYNDLHFDNFIYDGEKLYLIDFDRTIISSLDYDMMIFKTMCENPSKFANEEDEDNIIDTEYEKIYQIFKENYKELFANKFTDDRIFIYQFIYLINQAFKCNNKKWIKQELQKFNLYFIKS